MQLSLVSSLAQELALSYPQTQLPQELTHYLSLGVAQSPNNLYYFINFNIFYIIRTYFFLSFSFMVLFISPEDSFS